MSTSSVSIFLFLAISFFLNFHLFCSNLLSRAFSSSISFCLKILLRCFNHLETSNSYLFYYLPVFHSSPISILPSPISISAFFAPNLFLVPFLISNPRYRHFLFNNFFPLLRHILLSIFPISLLFPEETPKNQPVYPCYRKLFQSKFPFLSKKRKKKGEKTDSISRTWTRAEFKIRKVFHYVFVGPLIDRRSRPFARPLIEFGLQM